MVFYNPIIDNFCTSTDYIFDKNCYIGKVISSLRCNGWLTMSVLSEKDDIPTKFNIGDRVFVQDNRMYGILEGRVTMSPTTLNKYYTFRLIDDSLVHNEDPSNL